MKLPIKKEYFDKIKAGEKMLEYRDAHITFVCEETGEKLRKEIKDVDIMKKPPIFDKEYPGLFEDEYLVVFFVGE